jgi:hypothetical protein
MQMKKKEMNERPCKFFQSFCKFARVPKFLSGYPVILVVLLPQRFVMLPASNGYYLPFHMPGSDQEGATYFGELEEAFMHQVASLRRTQAATTSTAHHGDATRKQLSACSLSSSQPLSLSGSDQDQENTQSFLSLAGQG